MPYPSKTSPDAIVVAALELVERENMDAVSLRAVAQAVGVAPNALYRHFANRRALMAAVADRGAADMHAAISAAVDQQEAMGKLHAAARAYVDFARSRPTLYRLVMERHDAPGGKLPAYTALWSYIVQIIGSIVGSERQEECAVALWGYLHGFVTLEHGGLFRGYWPTGEEPFGLAPVLAGIRNSEPPS